MKIVPKKFKVHSLTGRITPELMRQAFKAVKRNRGAAGLDNVWVTVCIAGYGLNWSANQGVGVFLDNFTVGTYGLPPDGI